MKFPSLMNSILILLLAQGAFAQSSYEDEINNELHQMYNSGQRMNNNGRARSGGGRVVGNDEVVEVAEPSRSARAGQPIYIYNSATPTANAQVQASQGQEVQQQPVTVVEASPLIESKAEQLRKQRQSSEMNTELKIVEELERSRMQDEKRRADRLFGDRMRDEEHEAEGRPRYNYGYGQHNQQPVVVAPQQYQQQVQVQKVEVETTDVGIQHEISTAVSDLKSENDNYYGEQLYVNGLIGLGQYPDAINVKGNLSLGVSLGTKFRERMLLEGNFLYGNYDVEHMESGVSHYIPEITSMDQYTLGGTFKYQILGGMLRPFIGSSLAYQYRSFTKTQYYIAPSDATSHAVDVGAVIGADIELSSEFSIGVDYRYLWNIYSQTDSQGYQSIVNPQTTFGTPIEEFNQSLLSFVGRVTF